MSLLSLSDYMPPYKAIYHCILQERVMLHASHVRRCYRCASGVSEWLTYFGERFDRGPASVAV
jgi:hypothetical protein